MSARVINCSDFVLQQGDKDSLGVIDLTTVTSVELNTGDDNMTLDIVTTEKYKLFIVVFVKIKVYNCLRSLSCFRTYTVKGDTDEELDSWYSAIKNKQVLRA